MDLSTASSGAAAPFDTALNLFTRIAEFPKPTIGKINGPALGGGVGLLFVTDIRIAVDNAFVQLAEVKRGLIPAIISLFIVPQLGPCLSKQYFLTGEKVPVQKLLQAGCITACVPGDKLDAVVADFAAVLLEGGPQAQSTIKQLVRVVDGADSKEGKTLFVKGVFEGMMKSKEAAYGMKAFLDKKKPDWLAYLGKPSAKL
ncbi:ClpP/crotonase-like domain-containing protein [Obelidium mucronatum]|nr:ClpP/crotonase-like domain-containing protein [Obelidium mucronatum]